MYPQFIPLLRSYPQPQFTLFNELYDEADCLAGCRRTGREPFKKSDRARNWIYEYQFDPEMIGMSEFEKYFGLKRNTNLQESFAILHNH